MCPQSICGFGWEFLTIRLCSCKDCLISPSDDDEIGNDQAGDDHLFDDEDIQEECLKINIYCSEDE